LTGAANVFPPELAALRLSRLVSISRNATRSAIESPLVDGYNWYGIWSRRLVSAAHSAEKNVSASLAIAPLRVKPPSDDSTTETIGQANSWIQEMEEFFVEAAPLETSVKLSESDPIAQALESDWNQSPPICLLSDGKQDHLRVDFESARLTPLQQRSAALVSILALGAASFWVRRTPAVMALVVAWPELLAVALGVAAWAWMRPSALGLLLAAIGAGLAVRRLVASMRDASQEKSPRHDDSRRSNSNPQATAEQGSQL
jgi:hypothetical protein